MQIGMVQENFKWIVIFLIGNKRFVLKVLMKMQDFFIIFYLLPSVRRHVSIQSRTN